MFCTCLYMGLSVELTGFLGRRGLDDIHIAGIVEVPETKAVDAEEIHPTLHYELTLLDSLN